MKKSKDVRSCLWNLPSSLDPKIGVAVARNFVSLSFSERRRDE